MEVKPLSKHYAEHEVKYWWYMGVIGFANEIHTPIILAYLVAMSRLYGLDEDYDADFPMYLCFMLAIPIIASTINSRWLIKRDHEPRIYMTLLGIFVAYGITFYVYFDPYLKPTIGIKILSAAAFIVTFVTSIGEAAMLGYFKGIP